MFEKVKQLLKKLQFKNLTRKKEPITHQTVRVVKVRTAKRIIGAFFLLFLGLAIISMIRSNLAVGKITKLEEQLKAVSAAAESSEDTSVEKVIDTSRLMYFTENYVAAFINVPAQEEARQQRTEQLRKYYVNSIAVNDGYAQGLSRIFKGFRLLSQKNDEVEPGKYVLTYEVTYDLVKPTLKERDNNGVKEQYYEDEAKTVVNYLAVPVIVQDEKIGIEGLPYFVSKTDDQLKGYEVVAEVVDSVSDPAVVAEIEKFLAVFFDKYASGTQEELKYLMAEPVGLNGSFQFVEIQEKRLYQLNGVIKAEVTYVLQEKDSDFTHIEKVVLALKKESDKWIVEKIER